MRTATKHVMGSFAAGLFACVAIVSMLGITQQPTERPKLDPRVEALLRQIKEAEDRVGDCLTQVSFWQQEMAADDTEVGRLQVESAACPNVAFFLGRAQGLSSRAANSFLDARLNLTLCQHRLQGLRTDLAAP